MPKSTVRTHPQCEEISVKLAAKVRLADISRDYGVSIQAASRHRQFMKTHKRVYWRQLRHVLLKRGVTKESFKSKTESKTQCRAM